MNSHKFFLSFLRKFIPFSDEEYEELFVPILKERKFQKKEMLVRAGEPEKYFNFITKGLVRKYFRKGKDETNAQISMEGQVIMCHQSFILDEPSDYNVEALEPTVVLSMNKADMEDLFNKSQKMERLGRLVVTFMMVVNDKWQMQLIKSPPRERFLAFVSKNPQMLQRVPQKHLASYLNIKPETFSRFKHLLRSHKVNSAT